MHDISNAQTYYNHAIHFIIFHAFNSILINAQHSKSFLIPTCHHSHSHHNKHTCFTLHNKAFHTILHQLHSLHTIKNEPNHTISNPRLNLLNHSYQNPHNNKVHLMSYPTLQTATETESRFKSYEVLKFSQKFCLLKNLDGNRFP